MGFSLVAVSGGFSLQGLLVGRAQALERTGFSGCGSRAQSLQLPGSRAQAQWLWCTGLAALQHVGSSQIRD